MQIHWMIAAGLLIATGAGAQTLPQSVTDRPGAQKQETLPAMPEPAATRVALPERSQAVQPAGAAQAKRLRLYRQKIVPPSKQRPADTRPTPVPNTSGHD